MPQIDVSIVIINYKTPELVKDCVLSIEQNSKFFSFEIIVVDNSGDSFDHLVGQVKSPFKVIGNGQNLGTCAANNLGANEAQGEYILFLNSDTLLVNNAIYEMLLALKSDPNAVCSGGNLYSKDLVPVASHVRRFPSPKALRLESCLFIRFFRKLFKRRLNLYFNYSQKPLKVFYICAADALVRKKEFISMGGWDNNIFMYGEEIEYGFRVMQLGKYMINTPSAKIIHFEGGSFNKKQIVPFNENRFRRFLDGNIIAYEDMHISALSYLKSYLKSLKSERIVYQLKGEKMLVECTNKKMHIIQSYIGKFKAQS